MTPEKPINQRWKELRLWGDGSPRNSMQHKFSTVVRKTAHYMLGSLSLYFSCTRLLWPSKLFPQEERGENKTAWDLGVSRELSGELERESFSLRAGAMRCGVLLGACTFEIMCLYVYPYDLFVCEWRMVVKN